jgi:hypothetical protein
METTKVSSSNSNAARTSSGANVVLNMPNITAPIRGIVGNVSKDGIMNIKTSAGEVKIYSRSPLASGENVILSVSKTKDEMHLKVISSATTSTDGPIEPISEQMTEDQSNFLVFKMPNRFKAQLTESLQIYPTSSTPAQGLKSTPDINVDSGGALQFLSYLSRGGLSDSFGKALQTTPSLVNLFPHLANLATALPSFIKKIDNKEVSIQEPKKLKADLEALQKLPEQLSDDEWNFTLVPINDGQKLITAKLFTKHPQHLEEDNQTSRRFIVELDMDKLGHIKIDGLLTSNQGKSSLNLAVKSSEPLPSDMQEELRSLFKISEEITGHSGSISFAKIQANESSPMTKALHNYCKDKVKDYWA